MTPQWRPPRINPVGERLFSILPPQPVKRAVPSFIQIDESVALGTTDQINLAELLSVPLTSLTVKIEDQPPPSP
jgi:hypothetical protein